MSCSNSFHAEQGFRLNLGPQETDLGASWLKARHVAAWPYAQRNAGHEAGFAVGFGPGAAWQREQQ